MYLPQRGKKGGVFFFPMYCCGCAWCVVWGEGAWERVREEGGNRYVRFPPPPPIFGVSLTNPHIRYPNWSDVRWKHSYIWFFLRARALEYWDTYFEEGGEGGDGDGDGEGEGGGETFDRSAHIYIHFLDAINHFLG